MAEMQAYGYHINGEDIGVFGSHRSGPDMVQRLDNLFMWNECLASYAPQALHAAGADPDQVFFDALSHRTMWMLFWNFTVHAVSWRHEGQPAPEDRPTEGQLALLRAFAAAGDDMVGKTILADGRGVSYAGVTRRILWSRRSQVIELAPDAASIDLLTGAVNRGTFTAAAYGVYALPLRAEKE
jgi:hypothetical protein